MRRVTYISGTRADFGLMRRTLLTIDESPSLSCDVIVTGMHLSPCHGHTADEVVDSGLKIRAVVSVPMSPTTGATMARGIGLMITAFVDALEKDKPDIVLLLGDRGEMLAGAIAASHLNIPVAHVHGGERSGTIDEPVRHAISKLAHIHLTATKGSRNRLIQMGEDSAHIHVTGAPGLDGLVEGVLPPRRAVMAQHRLDPEKPFALMVYHPVLQQGNFAGVEAQQIIAALQSANCAVLALLPNADAGSDLVRSVLSDAATTNFTIIAHLARDDFVAAMAAADIMIGNSSAGIIEAASFGTPVINVGVRQNLRERNVNVRDTDADGVGTALSNALAAGCFPVSNAYGDGKTARRIVDVLAVEPLASSLTMKINAY